MYRVRSTLQLVEIRPDRCNSEPAGGGRVFPYLITNATYNSVEQCLTQCSAYGYPAAGLEYGQQCFCGTRYVH
jgi:WSC domain